MAHILRAFGKTTRELDSSYVFSEVRAGDDIAVGHVTTTAAYGEPQVSNTTVLERSDVNNYKTWKAVAEAPDTVIVFTVFSDAAAALTDLDTGLPVAAPPDTTPQINLATNGSITVTETVGDLLAGHVHSTGGDVTLFSPLRILDADGGATIEVTGANITMIAGTAGVQGGIGLAGDFLEINVARDGSTGVLNATDTQAPSTAGIYLDDLLGDMRVDTVHTTADVSLRTVEGSIVDGRTGASNDGAANVLGRAIDLDANGSGGIGGAGVALKIDSSRGSATPVLSAGGDDVAIEAGNGINLIETDGHLRLVLAHAYQSNIQLGVRESLDVDENFLLIHSGEARFAESDSRLPGNDPDAPRGIDHGQVFAEAGSVTIRAGDDIDLSSNSEIVAALGIDLYGDDGSIETGNGSTITLRGRLVAGAVVTAGDPVASYVPSAAAPVHKTNVWGNADADFIDFGDTSGSAGGVNWGDAGYIFIGSQTRVHGSADAESLVDDGEDLIRVYFLQDANVTTGPATAVLDGTSGNYVPRAAQHSLLIDGQAGTDAVEVYTLGSRGNERNYLINVLDTGAKNDGKDTLAIYGRDSAANAEGGASDDLFLLRGMSDIVAEADESPGFVALLHGTVEQARQAAGDAGYNRSAEVQRINYDINLNGRVTVYGQGGNDHFAVDDNAAITTLDGGKGSDNFQIGQLFGEQRNETLGRLVQGDEFATIGTTRGYLSRGTSMPLVATGGEGNDQFNVYSNQAELRLEGDAGNDEFVVRAFALAVTVDSVIQRDSLGIALPLLGGGFSTDTTTTIRPGEGDDQVQYNVNAPVSIDGGSGFDKVVVLGTEFGDNIVITKDGIYGAGLTVRFANVEVVEVDGLEGDDDFFVLST
ncbi:MAG: hypothetical protein MUF16_00045, partial [Burkholderiaceae bacterium]|nr:hypothetical protein [Burkholderiaceae bacterium]